MNIKFINAYTQKIIYEKELNDELLIINMINNFVQASPNPVFIKSFSNNFIKVEFVNWIKKSDNNQEETYILYFK